jgi:hypothetical protein
MKIAILICTVLLFASSALATPFLVAEKGAGGVPTSYEVMGLPLQNPIVQAQSDGNFRLDLASLPEGTYTVQLKAKNLWGESPYSDPFTFTRDPLPGKPKAPTLSAQ